MMKKRFVVALLASASMLALASGNANASGSVAVNPFVSVEVASEYPTCNVPLGGRGVGTPQFYGDAMEVTANAQGVAYLNNGRYAVYDPNLNTSEAGKPFIGLAGGPRGSYVEFPVTKPGPTGQELWGGNITADQAELFYGQNGQLLGEITGAELLKSGIGDVNKGYSQPLIWHIRAGEAVYAIDFFAHGYDTPNSPYTAFSIDDVEMGPAPESCTPGS